ncbi:MAG: DEAD/DEAH box helicase [Anaerolineaceae bacterium]|nr:DEAD/DEAH box helicase [Anaerolineaceae bacterium]MCB9100446.1 DEAD/DEAH box helicase [Anaerolineales bacterium]
MARVYVSLDIETTGLNPDRDEILEIGAVRFKGNQTYDEFSVLVNPGCPIPYKIQQLTGILPEDIEDAPPISAVTADLQRFVGDNPIIGHNINFDLSFLRKHGVLHENIGIDTFELASILLPHATIYSLSALLEHLDVPPPEDGQAHRALDDAQAARQLFEALLDQARRLDSRIIQEVARVSAKTKWPLSIIFRDLSRERRYSAPAGTLGQQLAAKGLIGDADTEGGFAFMLGSNQQRFDPPLKPAPELTSLNLEKLCRMLETNGLFEKNFSEFEYRPQQVDMMANVIGALNESQHLMVEAGTGTGKSMAYLIPAIYWAVQNGQRVVISTNTINLQDQLLNKDIPRLQQMLPIKFKAIALKGRSNYVCPRRVQMFQAKENHSPTELRLLAKLLTWLPSTTTGDREELFMPDYAEQALWSQVASDGNICTPRYCTAENCFYARARRAAESAHIIVVNHALLMADIGVESKIIPEYKYLIIDEAHHLEDNITNQLTFSIDQKSLEQLLRELSQPLRGSDRHVGFIHEIARRALAAIPNHLKGDVNDIIYKSQRVIDKSVDSTRQLFTALANFVNEIPNSRSPYNYKIRLTDDTRSQSAWSDVEVTWDNTSAGLSDVSRSLGILYTMLTEMEAFDIPNWEELLANLASYRGRLDEIRTNIHQILTNPSRDRILWVEQSIQNRVISLHNAPLHVGPLVQEHLLKAKEVIVFTSATMRTNNSFEYFQERLDLWDAEGAAVGSPFDYENNTLVYIPIDMPEPNTPGHQKVFEEGLVELAKRIKGRTLVLFTAYSQLRNSARNIKGPLAEAGIVVYQQGDGSSRRQILENFVTTDQAVLLGTRSFWEGVDIPGPALSCVVIARIPFAVPSDPVVAARSETFDEPFYQYSIPQAILMFRQGFGRLIRQKDDRGVVVIFDRRVVSKNYGQAFLDSLPSVTEQRDVLANLPSMAENWIYHEGI